MVAYFSHIRLERNENTDDADVGETEKQALPPAAGEQPHGVHQSLKRTRSETQKLRYEEPDLCKEI